MEIFTMKCFICAVDCGSLSKAAEKMCITQPALSMQIKKLEQEFKVTLINRNSHSFSVTEEGKVVYDSFFAILGTYTNLEWQLRQMKNDRKTLRVGYHGPTYWANIPVLFEKFMRDNPQIQINVNVMELGRLDEMVRNGDVDIAIVINGEESSYDRDEMVYRKLFRELGCLGMNHEHPLANRTVIHSEDLEGQIIYMNSGGKRFESEKPFINAGLQPSNVRFVDGYIATITNAQANDALVIMPRSFKLERDNIVYVDHDIESLAVEYYAICKKENMTKEVKLFMEACERFEWQV